MHNKIVPLFILLLATLSYANDYDLKTIIKALDTYEKQLDSIKLKYSYESYEVDGKRDLARGLFSQKASDKYILIFQTSKTGKTWKNAETSESLTRSYNGEFTKYLKNQKNERGYYKAALYKSRNLKLYQSTYNPYYRIIGNNCKNKFKDSLSDPNSMVKIQCEETLDSFKTVKINYKPEEGFWDCNLWLLPERNYLPLKFTCRAKTVRDREMKLSWSEFNELKNGIWFPMKIKMYYIGIDEPVSTFTVENVDISPLTKEDFNFEFPPLTHITNHIEGKTLWIDENGKCSEIKYTPCFETKKRPCRLRQDPLVITF